MMSSGSRSAAASRSFRFVIASPLPAAREAGSSLKFIGPRAASVKAIVRDFRSEWRPVPEHPANPGNRPRAGFLLTFAALCVKGATSGSNAVARLPKAFRPSTALCPLAGPRLLAECVTPCRPGPRPRGLEQAMPVTVFGFPRSTYVKVVRLILTEKRRRLSLPRHRPRDVSPGAPRAASVRPGARAPARRFPAHERDRGLCGRGIRRAEAHSRRPAPARADEPVDQQPQCIFLSGD